MIVHPWPIVAAPVAAGRFALTISPGGAITSIALRIPWFQGIPAPRVGAVPPKIAPTSAPSVQLMYVRAWGEESRMSKRSTSPSFSSLTSVV